MGVNLTLTPDQVASVVAQAGTPPVTDPPPTDPPPVVDPPAGDDPLVVLLQSAKFHNQGPASRKYDLARKSKLGQRAVPLNIPMVQAGPAGNTTPIFAKSMNGAVSKTQTKVHIYGAPTHLYSETQWFDPVTGVSNPLNTEYGDDMSQIVAFLKEQPMRDGARGVGMPHGYASYISHPHLFDADTAPNNPEKWGTPIPRAPVAILIGHDGSVWLLYNDRVVLAGFIPGVVHVHGACVDRSDRSQMYGAVLGPKVGNVYTGARIVRIKRGAGKGGPGSPEDASKYTVEDVLTGLSYVTSVDTDKAGNVYAVDAGAGKIYRISKDGTVAASWTTCAVPFALRYFNGTLYVACRDGGVRLVDAASGACGPNIMPAQYILAPFTLGVDFMTMSVDLNGTAGPAGRFKVSRVHTINNCNLWRFDADAPAKYSAMVATNADVTATAAQKTAASNAYANAVKYGQNIVTPSEQGWNSVGTLATDKEWHGHYSWIEEYDEFQAIEPVFGFADTLLSIVVHDGPYPAGAEINYTWIWKGKATLSRAGYTTVVTPEGWSPFAGCSWDEIADRSTPSGEPDFDGMRAWYASGMITETPRPELASGTDVLKLVGATVRNSCRYLREGKIIVDKWAAWAAANGLPASAPSDTVVSPYNPEASTYWEVREKSKGTYEIAPFGLGSSTPIRGTNANRQSTPVPADATIVLFEGIPGMETTSLASIEHGSGKQYAATVRIPSIPGAASRAVVIVG